jgi:hypothetical protein
MATLTKGTTYANGTTVTPTNLNAHVDSATVTFTTAADTDNSTLEISSNQFRVKDLGIATGKIAAGAVTGPKLATKGVVQTIAAETSDGFATTSGSLVVSGGLTTSNTQQFGTSGLSVSVTPTSASNTILVRAVVPCSAPGAAGGTPVLALFRGTMAIGATIHSIGAFSYANIAIEALDAPNTMSATTYSVRAGHAGTAGCNINLNASGSAFFGGNAVVLSATEINA